MNAGRDRVGRFEDGVCGESGGFGVWLAIGGHWCHVG